MRILQSECTFSVSNVDTYCPFLAEDTNKLSQRLSKTYGFAKIFGERVHRAQQLSYLKLRENNTFLISFNQSPVHESFQTTTTRLL